MANIDMITRILKLYDALAGGQLIKKSTYCMENGISERTFDRDIEKIRNYLSESFSGKEVLYLTGENAYGLADAHESEEKR